MTCFITLKCWTDDDNVVQMFVAFFFNQVEQGEISTFCGASEYDFVWFFDIVCHFFLFDVRMKNQLIPARPRNIHDLSCLV